MISSPTRGRLAAALLTLCFAPVAMAQAGVGSPGRSARPDPLDARAVVPAPAYQSSFLGYRRLSDEPVVSWREANDAVARIGGWRVYAREAHQPAPPAGAAAAPVVPPAASAPAVKGPAMLPSYGGHKMP